MTSYEVVMKRFVPAFRSSAARMMINDYGLRQQQAAKILGTTQAAISKYLSEKAPKNKGIKIDQKQVREYIERMLKHHEHGGQKALCKMCQSNVKFDCAFMVK
ncbi:MAG: transcriptional regulator [Candidatus Micrarchaeaceae archaeon]